MISGNGCNRIAIANAAKKEQWHEELHARVVCVISDQADADAVLPALPGWALQRRSSTTSNMNRAMHLTPHFSAASTATSYQPALVLLAGFMRILTPGFVAHCAGRPVNIHPSLLPAFTGLDTHRP